jgi:hypothetical protein
MVPRIGAADSNRFDLIIVDLNRNALLQEVNSDEQPIFAAAANDNAFEPHEQAALDADALSWLQSSLGSKRNAGLDQRADVLQVLGHFVNARCGPDLRNAVRREGLNALFVRAVDE